MQKTRTTTKPAAPRKKTQTRTVARAKRIASPAPTRTARRPAARATQVAHSGARYVVENGQPAYVLVPIDEYEKLIEAGMAAEAIAQIERGDDGFVDADEFFRQLAGERIANARKAVGLSQTALGAKLGVPQSQISRIERNPDRTTVRTLKRIAKALGVDVSALV